MEDKGNWFVTGDDLTRNASGWNRPTIKLIKSLELNRKKKLRKCILKKK
jgi:hypothetical protein